MTLLYVYALLDRGPEGDLGAGLTGEPLRVVPTKQLFAVVGEISTRPAPSPGVLRAHDETIRRIGTLAPAVLPCRFGQVASDERRLVENLSRQEEPLLHGVRRVHGAVQMTLRVYDRGDGEVRHVPPARNAAQGAQTDGGPGTRYLRSRRRLPSGFEDFRRRVQPGVRAERVEPGARPPLVATLYHLIDALRASEYRREVEAESSRVPGLHVAVSGPWPAYAFADGAAST